jgi:hypothetical protein
VTLPWLQSVSLKSGGERGGSGKTAETKQRETDIILAAQAAEMTAQWGRRRRRSRVGMINGKRQKKLE